MSRPEQHDELYQELADLCRRYGVISDTTAGLLHSAVESITPDETPPARTFLALRWTEADLRIAWAASEDRDDDPDGLSMPAEILDGMLRCARKIEERISELGGQVIDDYLAMGLWQHL